MTQVVDDRILETTTTTGTGTVTLAGALTGFQTFASRVANGNRVSYLIRGVDANGLDTGEWETGLGTWATGGTLSRDVVFKSSNSDALVSFSSGTKRVHLALLSNQMYRGPNGIPFRALEALSPGFDAWKTWTFDTDDEGWTAVNGTIAFDSSNGFGVLVDDTSTSSALILRSPSGLNINGNYYRDVKISLTRTAGTSRFGVDTISYGVNFQYVTPSTGSNHSFSASYRKIVQPPEPFDVGDTIILHFNMTDLPDGGDDWEDNTITQIQFVLTQLTADDTTVRVNWVSVGRSMPRAVPQLDWWDFWNETQFNATGTPLGTYNGAAISSGTNTTAIPSSSLLGYTSGGVFIRSSATSGSGYRYQTTSLVADYCGPTTKKFICQFQFLTSITNTVAIIGYFDINTATGSVVDGVYFAVSGSTVSGSTSKASTGSNTSGGTLAVGKVYTFDIEVTANAGSARFRIYEDQIAIPIFDQSLTTNLPNTTSNLFGNGICAGSTAGSASDIGILYLMGFGTIAGFRNRRNAILS